MPKLTTRNLTIGFGVFLTLVAVFADSFGLGQEPRLGREARGADPR